MNGNGDLRSRDDRPGPDRAETAVTLVSVLAVTALFLYAVVQAATVPATPVLTASILAVREEGQDLLVDVELLNLGGVGVRSAEIEVTCREPAPTLTFDHVPAGGRRTATVVCPSADDIEVRVVGWVQR